MKVFGPKEKRVIGDWRRVLNEERHELYSSPKNTGGIQSRKMRWEGHVERKGRGEERPLEVFGGVISRKETTWKN